jgi:hypothetical protein
MITISHGGTSYTFPNLTETPFGYEEGDVRRGRAVRRWGVTGIVKHSDAPVITGLFEAWTAAKLLEDDPIRTGTTGATVGLSGSSPGYSWSTPVPCWFAGAPSLQLAGAFTRVSLVLADAAQSLAVQLRQGEEDAEQFAALSLGTLTFGGAVITLTSRPNDFTGLPSVSPNPAGKSIISGPLQLTPVRRVVGEVNSTNLALLETWLASVVSTTPATGAWVPIEWSPPVAKRRADGGVMATYFDVSFTVTQIQ